MVNESKITLLDTQPWLWFVLGDDQLPSHVRERIEIASSTGNLFLSVISIWQVADFVSSEYISLKKPCQTWIDEAIDRSGIRLVPFDTNIAVESCQLPELNARLNMPSRVIIASARTLGATLISADQAVIDLAANRYVEVIAA